MLLQKQEDFNGLFIVFLALTKNYIDFSFYRYVFSHFKSLTYQDKMRNKNPTLANAYCIDRVVRKLASHDNINHKNDQRNDEYINNIISNSNNVNKLFSNFVKLPYKESMESKEKASSFKLLNLIKNDNNSRNYSNSYSIDKTPNRLINNYVKNLKKDDLNKNASNNMNSGNCNRSLSNSHYNGNNSKLMINDIIRSNHANRNENNAQNLNNSANNSISELKKRDYSNLIHLNQLNNKSSPISNNIKIVSLNTNKIDNLNKINKKSILEQDLDNKEIYRKMEYKSY